MKSIRDLSKILAFVGLAMGLSGCATMSSKKAAGGAATSGSEEQPVATIPGGEDASKDVMANIAKPYQSPLGEIPLDVTPLTEKWIQYFQGRGRKYMEKYLERSSRYVPMMKNTLRENGLPEDLVYIALIESGFSPLAHSHANAVGYWQFIRSTGKRYGLMVDPFIDERRDPVLSTRAAAEYFKALYNLFGSWHLSLASYNVGENRVKRAVMNYYTRDFWELVKKRKAFPKETKHYVPKFIAAALIARDPAKYGFTNIEYQAPLAFDTVKLVNPVSLTKLASEMNVSVEEMQALNPKFRGDYVPKYRGDETVIRVPVGASEKAVAAIPASFIAQPKVVASDYYFYRIKRGDVLSTVARRHHTSVANLRRINNLSNRSILRVGQRLRVPDRGGAFVTYEMPSDSGASTNAPAETQTLASQGESSESSDEQTSENVTHVVRRGENLSTIARKYGLSVEDLRRLNKLSNRAILKVGQVLRLRNAEQQSESKPQADESTKVVSKSSKAITHIARQQKARVSELKRQSIKHASWVKPLAKKVAEIRHRVKRGETLADIARRYRVSVGRLARENDIKSRSRLLAGAELVIPR